jgi:hypothetical protein
VGRVKKHLLRLVASSRHRSQPRAAEAIPRQKAHCLRIHADPDRAADADSSAGLCRGCRLIPDAVADMGRFDRLIGLAEAVLGERGARLCVLRQSDLTATADSFETTLENLAAARTAAIDPAFVAHIGNLTPAHVLAKACTDARIKAAGGGGRSRGTAQKHQIFVKTPRGVDDS